MSFESDCNSVPELVGASKQGLQALNAQDLAHVSKHPQSRLTSSIDVDTALRPHQPNSNRWDYGVARLVGKEEFVHWIEVHPASGGGNISEISLKLSWLKNWLNSSGLNAYKREVVWVASGKSAFNARHPKIRALAMNGLRFAGGHIVI